VAHTETFQAMTAAGASLLTLRTATGGLAEARTFTATDAKRCLA